MSEVRIVGSQSQKNSYSAGFQQEPCYRSRTGLESEEAPPSLLQGHRLLEGSKGTVNLNCALVHFSVVRWGRGHLCLVSGETSFY